MPDVLKPRRLGDVNDAAALLKCSTRTVRRQAELGALPGVCRIARLWRIDLDLLGRWIDQGCPMLSQFDVKGGQH